MGFWSFLFKRRPTPPTPSPYPIRGRDAEFTATITTLYREELGREPDAGGLASWLHAAQYGMTGERIRQYLHDSEEGAAYRARPKFVTPFDPIDGRLVVRPDGVLSANGRVRVPMYDSDFPLVRFWADGKKDLVRQALETTARAGWQGKRVAAPLAEREDQDGGFWVGCHSTPEMVLDVITDLADEFANHRLQLHLFGAHAFAGGWEAEKRFITDLCTKLRDAGHAQTIGLFEWRNEFYVTSPYGGLSDETYAHGDEACRIAKAILGGLVTMGAPGEDDDAIARSVRYGDIAGLDFGRDLSGDLIMKHYHRAYYDGRFHGKYQRSGARALWFLEPTGPNAPGHEFPDGVYIPLNDPAFLWGMYGILRLTGQAFSALHGPSVRHRIPLDLAPGYTSIPAQLQFIPEEACTWQGPTWFVKPGSKEWVTVLAEEWGNHTRPDHPIAHWTAMFHDGSTVAGEGPINLPPGWKAAAFKGAWV